MFNLNFPVILEQGRKNAGTNPRKKTWDNLRLDRKTQATHQRCCPTLPCEASMAARVLPGSFEDPWIPCEKNHGQNCLVSKHWDKFCHGFSSNCSFFHNMSTLHASTSEVLLTVLKVSTSETAATWKDITKPAGVKWYTYNNTSKKVFGAKLGTSMKNHWTSLISPDNVFGISLPPLRTLKSWAHWPPRTWNPSRNLQWNA